jgi:thiamine phosphate synthase YjbQ (UPF0047 family)
MPGHIKSTLIGASINVPITDGKFNLGTWQGKETLYWIVFPIVDLY